MNNILENKRNNKLGKSYKLCSKLIINQLFHEGKEIKNFPFVLKYKISALPPNSSAFQIVFVVPKKKFNHATTRNQIKRYMREAIRLNKHDLETTLINKKTQLALFLLYLGKREIDFNQFEQKINVLLSHLVKEIEYEN